MNNLLITKENKKTKRFILVFLLFTIYFFNGSLILAQNERISVNVKNESVEVVLKKITKRGRRYLSGHIFQYLGKPLFLKMRYIFFIFFI